MTPIQLDTLSQDLLPGASMTRRAKHVAEIVKRSKRAVLYWFSGKTIIPHWAVDLLLAEQAKVLKQRSKKVQLLHN